MSNAELQTIEETKQLANTIDASATLLQTGLKNLLDARENFHEYRGHVMCEDVEVPAGVYDDNCAVLEELGLAYDFDAEE